MSSTLREELASLRIERDRARTYAADPISIPGGPRPTSRRGGGGLRLVSWLLWLVPLGLLSAGGAFAYRRYDEIRSRPEVTRGLVQRMTSGEAEKLLSAKGYLKSRYQSMIGTKIPGRVERMYVHEGMKVKKGDTLAVIEHNEMSAVLASREARALQARAELEEGRAEAWEKEREHGRLGRLHSARKVTEEEYEKGVAEWKKAKARVDALEAAVNLSDANVRETKALIDLMSIYAPFDGTVVEKQGEEGEIITPTAMSSALGRTAVVTIADLSTMDVETDVSETLLSRIALGQPAEISVSAVPMRRYRGRLRQVLPMGDRARGTVKVKVEILDPDDRLFPELAATVHFLPNRTSGRDDLGQAYLFLPKSAIFQENGHDHVWVIGPGDRVRKRRVEVATTTDALARVESGLSAGESVVVGPPSSLRDRATVRIAD